MTTLGRYDYPYFVDYLKDWFLSNPAFGETREDRYKLLFTGGLRIHTTIQPAVQHASQHAVDSVLSYPNDPSAAVTVLDPRNGFVLAMVGGDQHDYWRDRAPGRVNLATAAGGTGRQSGSAFKPFALVAALEAGMSPSETFPAPSTLRLALDSGEIWDVTNAEGAGYGSMTLRAATVRSVNTVYAQVIDRLGPGTVVEVAKRMGLRCCRQVSNPRHPLEPYLLGRARHERGEHPGDGVRVRDPRVRRRAGPGPSRCRGSPTREVPSSGRRARGANGSSTPRWRPSRTGS